MSERHLALNAQTRSPQANPVGRVSPRRNPPSQAQTVVIALLQKHNRECLEIKTVALKAEKSPPPKRETKKWWETMKFSKYFKLKKKQAELDFVDVDVDEDTELYIDPYAIELATEPLAETCNEILREFFQEVLNAIRKSDRLRVGFLMSNLH
ncbi:hypothetical protein ACQKH5_08400 [Hyphomonas sp. NPDC076900]|uniref:hypothetical protein n=1 Tax=unclassified Hyphomonas TaxID=2630699 RepID=UPI003D00953C